MAELTEPFRTAIKAAVLSMTEHERFYPLLNGVGPFDGGCLIVGLAIQNVFGGELWALRRSEEMWSLPLNPDQHIVVSYGPDWFVDGLGGLSRREMLEYWEHERLVELVPTTANYAKRSCGWMKGWGDGLTGIEAVEELSWILQGYITDGFFVRQNLERSEGLRAQGVFVGPI